ncbi:hypothetical protein [Thioalkalivibrio sp. ALgr3]|uniref:hypothetical protein n=1 Tax=Thioalkalivibrio sp. ALgr3 TaxID=1239292 RepID=UPI0012DD1580|nr:hypothetical protein [Thioalkalivibrio sp. ALgr3]
MNLLKLTYRYLQPNPIRSFLSILVCLLRGRRSHALKVIRVDPQNIKQWLTPKEDPGIVRSWPGQVMGGKWHIHAKNIESCDSSEDVDCLKQTAFYERFYVGKSWGETGLFKNYYRKKILLGPVRGKENLEDLLKFYEGVYESIYEDIKINGVRVPTLSDPEPTFIHVHMGPNGEVIASDNGNHRIAIARQLGLRSIPVKILRLHKSAKDHVF